METSYLQNTENGEKLSDNTKCRQAVGGALLFIAIVTKPDTDVTANILSRKNENSTTRDWNTVKRVIS